MLIVYGREPQSSEVSSFRPDGTCAFTPSADNWFVCSAPGAVTWSAVNYTQAFADLKGRLLTPSGMMERANVIDRAYFNAFGRSSTADEQLYWENRMMNEMLWYAPIATAALAYLNNPSNRAGERTATIHRAYQATLGRDASASDLAYWLPRSEHYPMVVRYCIDWLYSPGGAGELPQVVRYAAATRLGRQPTEAEVKSLLVKALLARAGYQQMHSMP
jgi:hypothetical protein